jgi:hypothetical protein
VWLPPAAPVAVTMMLVIEDGTVNVYWPGVAYVVVIVLFATIAPAVPAVHRQAIAVSIVSRTVLSI